LRDGKHELHRPPRPREGLRQAPGPQSGRSARARPARGRHATLPVAGAGAGRRVDRGRRCVGARREAVRGSDRPSAVRGPRCALPAARAPRSIGAGRRRLPAAMAALLDACLEPAPAERPSVHELLDALERVAP